MEDHHRIRAWVDWPESQYKCSYLYQDTPFGYWKDDEGDEWMISDWVGPDALCLFELCTGLKDKAGRLIYEGDIVKMDNFSPQNYQAGFEDGEYCLLDKDGEFCGRLSFVQHAGIKQGEVIGNIHENPELLKTP